MSLLYFPITLEIDNAKQDALAAIERMRFPEGTVWELASLGPYECLRDKDNALVCPLVAWARHEGYNQANGRDSGMIIGLSTRTVAHLMAAADQFPGMDPDIRAALLRKCGLDNQGGEINATITG